METDTAVAQNYMDTVRTLGQEYGLTLNDLRGKLAKHKTSMTYLGSLLSADRRVGAELSRRIGAAQKAFNELARVWKHDDVSRSRKLKVYYACVISRLMYCLHTAWLNEAEKTRLDAFHCRCLRRIYGVKDAYYSRVSAVSILAMAGTEPLRATLLNHQLQLYGDIARKPDGDPIREAVLTTSTVRPRQHEGHRRVGRARHQWNNEVFREALRVAGNTTVLSEMLADSDAARNR